MKRLSGCFALAVVLALGGGAAEEPPSTDWSGWLVSGLPGEPPVVIEEGAPLGAAASGINLLSDAPFSQPAASGALGTVDLSLGMQTSLPVSTNGLVEEIARCLDYDWVFCYLFVRDNIRYVPYRGIARGPERTLIDREGNDADQALLLCALLRASGYATATVCYSPMDYYGRFRMPLAGSAQGYDAVHWLGIRENSTLAEITNEISRILGPARVPYGWALSETPQTSQLAVERYYVSLTNDLTSMQFLDAALKPQAVKPASGTLLADMGYSRSNLLACAGGTVSNEWFVQGVSASGLSNELSRLCANLVSAWRTNGHDVLSGDLLGGNEIVQQDMSADTACFHGSLYTFLPYDFLAQSDAVKNSYRAWLRISYGGITNTCWMDELGGRSLWLSYTNTFGSQFTNAVLRLDDSEVAVEPLLADAPDDTALITTYHLSYPWQAIAPYTLSRSVDNVYAVPLGFGADYRGRNRALAAEAVARERCSGLAEDAPAMRMRVACSIGMQWLAQSSLLYDLSGRLDGTPQHFLYNTGIVGHDKASFVDFKNGAVRAAKPSSVCDRSHFFFSALECGVLDQVNGRDRPSVSTVRLMGLANAGGAPIYLATSSNWQRVRSALVGYSQEMLADFDEDMAAGRSLLLPENGVLTLGGWSGHGYIDFGPASASGTYSYGMVIGGNLNGGLPSTEVATSSGEVASSRPQDQNQSANIGNVLSHDPIDMRTGAAFLDRNDLSSSVGPSPLPWGRHYDSRQRWNDGALGRGWSHGFESRVSVHTDYEPLIGGGSPAACAAAVVACSVAGDMLSAGMSARSLVVASLAADWWAGQLLENGATVTAGGKALSFTRLTDGSYEPCPGVTASLNRTEDGRFELRERLGRVWSFSANGILVSVTDPSGNVTGLEYADDASLISVTNAFGAKLEFGWSDGRIGTVTDNAGRIVRYAYSRDGCLTGVTDTAGEVWKLAYDAEGALLSETDPSGIATVRNAYNALGQVTNQLSASGQTWLFAYADGWRSWEADPFLNRSSHGFTADGRPAWRFDRGDAFYEFAYDGRGNLVTNLDALGRMTVSAFDASNRLTRVTEAAGTPDERTTAFAYDSRHRLVAVTNALGRVTRMRYDDRDRLSLTVLPDGTAVTNAYDARGLPTLTRALDADGNVLRETSTAYNARGLPEAVTATGAGTTRYAYDAAGNATNITDALGRSLALSYNARGQLTATVDALGHTTAHLYTPEGRLQAAVDALGRTNRFLWTPGGKPAAVIDPDGGVSTNEYDIADRLAAVKDPRGSRVAFGLDAAGRVTNRTAAAWSDTMQYDAAGRLVARVDAVSGLTENGYDNLDRPVAVTDPAGRVWTKTYDALGALTAATDPRGRQTAYAYDAVGRLTATVHPSGRTEGNGYDALGRLTSFTNAEGRVYRMAYDAQGRLLAATNAAGEQVVRNLYDLAGNLTNRTDGAGNTIRYTYDALNRLVARDAFNHETHEKHETFTYDAVGNLLTASNETARLAFSYDAMNRLVSSETRVAGQVFGVSYAYDLGGLCTNVVYPGGGAVRYGYDADGRVTHVTDWAGRAWTFTRDPAGRLTALSCPNGVTGAWTHDANHAVASWSWSAGGPPFAGRIITRDEAGIKTKEQVTAGLFPNPQNPRRAINTFDAADRLVSSTVAQGTNTYAETYLYDLNGALTNKQSAIGNERYEYDCAGRLSGLQLLNPNSSILLAYDAIGNRLTTYSASVTRIWITDHADPRKRPLIEADAGGMPVRYYIWGGGLLLAVVEADGTMRYCHSDEQGSIVALTDSNGDVTDQFCYGPYGTDWGRTGTNSIPFRWLGSHGVFNVGGSALHLTRYRAYDASLCRFLSADPLGLGGGPNLYAYCRGSPLAYIDPLGLGAESVWGAATSGFREGLGGGLSILANTFTFGATDMFGWTDSASYVGSEYSVSRFAATAARESVIALATLGIGSSGSAAAQATYKGILAVEAATGGWQVGTGAQQIYGGDYEAGALNVVAGGLRVAGSIVNAGAVAPKGPSLGNDPTKAPPGTEWRGKPGSAPGSGQGNYYNPATGESYRPDLSHPDPIGPHWDYQRRGEPGPGYRIYPDGRIEPKR
jgi:RHS repeat-associated protein